MTKKCARKTYRRQLLYIREIRSGALRERVTDSVVEVMNGEIHARHAVDTARSERPPTKHKDELRWFHDRLIKS